MGQINPNWLGWAAGQPQPTHTQNSVGPRPKTNKMSWAASCGPTNT